MFSRVSGNAYGAGDLIIIIIINNNNNNNNNDNNNNNNNNNLFSKKHYHIKLLSKFSDCHLKFIIMRSTFNNKNCLLLASGRF